MTRRILIGFLLCGLAVGGLLTWERHGHKLPVLSSLIHKSEVKNPAPPLVLPSAPAPVPPVAQSELAPDKVVRNAREVTELTRQGREDCFFVGDSIALAVGQATGCAVNAKIGEPSSKIIARVPPTKYDTVVVSAGSNDPDNPSLRANLEKIRAAVRAKRVVWIVPYCDATHKRLCRAASVVEATAANHGDQVSHFRAAADWVHPKCDGCVARVIFPSKKAP